VLATGWRYARRLHCFRVVTAACCVELRGPTDGRSPQRTSARTILRANRLFANGFANERDEIRPIGPDWLDRKSPETRALPDPPLPTDGFDRTLNVGPWPPTVGEEARVGIASPATAVSSEFLIAAQ
jgi:hypothetical protein